MIRFLPRSQSFSEFYRRIRRETEGFLCDSCPLGRFLDRKHSSKETSDEMARRIARSAILFATEYVLQGFILSSGVRVIGAWAVRVFIVSELEHFLKLYHV